MATVLTGLAIMACSSDMLVRAAPASPATNVIDLPSPRKAPAAPDQRRT